MRFVPLPVAAGGPPVGIFLLFLLLGGIAVAFAIWSERKRRAELSTFARSQGWRFAPDRDTDFERRYPGWKRLREGHSRYATNVITGARHEREICVFDYHYTTGSGKNQSKHHFTGVALDAGFHLTPLKIRREHLFDTLAAAFGFDDIDFESAEFSRRYHVASPNKEWAYAVIHQETMEFLLHGPSYPVEFEDHHACTWGTGLLDANGIRSAIMLVEGVLDRIPQDVRERSGRFGYGA